jgi:hypothetical protein
VPLERAACRTVLPLQLLLLDFIHCCCAGVMLLLLLVLLPLTAAFGV